MKVRYDKNDDILMVVLNRKKIDDTYETENGFLSVTEKGEPVLLEIFNASKFFAEEGKVLPKEIKEKFFSPSSIE